MSFSFDVKREICALDEKNKYIMFYGMIAFADKITPSKLQIVSENVFVINILEELSGSLFDVHFMLSEGVNTYIATLEGESYSKVCDEYHIDPAAVQMHLNEDIIEGMDAVSAFLKGAFLTSGSVTNPYSAYHLELVTHYYQFSKEVAAFLQKMGFSFKSVVRKSHYVLYLKDSVLVERFLYVLGAKNAAFELVNAKILKQVQNDNNRVNNCQEYNRDKSMDKSIEQLLAIQKIQENKGVECLPSDLQEVVNLRLQNQYASLSELCRLSEGKFSKAGLSRRLSKIVEIANKIQEKE